MKKLNNRISEEGFVLNKSRRKFFSFLGTATLLSFSFIFLASSKKNLIEEEFILIDGWFLKKTDFYDL